MRRSGPWFAPALVMTFVVASIVASWVLFVARTLGWRRFLLPAGLVALF